uniref:Uncharacterized protein n=1 Tax=Octactis speculum TaxID=3111310 RepID=A0A7S2FZ36_9STRA|mmetsp:Transcript_33203/g.44933  ORF Transcript_33203/g.44933 Transcript_33203/m.44933 type:complete len:170 (+) Transcript_33203:45-554(+)
MSKSIFSDNQYGFWKLGQGGRKLALATDKFCDDASAEDGADPLRPDGCKGGFGRSGLKKKRSKGIKNRKSGWTKISTFFDNERRGEKEDRAGDTGMDMLVVSPCSAVEMVASRWSRQGVWGDKEEDRTTLTSKHGSLLLTEKRNVPRASVAASNVSFGVPSNEGDGAFW